MSVEAFKTGINEVKIAASSDTTRPALTGVYLIHMRGLYILQQQMVIGWLRGYLLKRWRAM